MGTEVNKSVYSDHSQNLGRLEPLFLKSVNALFSLLSLWNSSYMLLDCFLNCSWASFYFSSFFSLSHKD